MWLQETLQGKNVKEHPLTQSSSSYMRMLRCEGEYDSITSGALHVRDLYAVLYLPRRTCYSKHIEKIISQVHY